MESKTSNFNIKNILYMIQWLKTDQSAIYASYIAQNTRQTAR